MKKVSYLLLSFTLILFSCGSDDEECTGEMLAGSYVGTLMCDDSSNNDDDILLTVTGTGNSIVITDEDGEEYEVRLNGCDFDVPEVSIDLFGIQFTVSGDGNFNGNTLNLNVETSAAGQSETCRFVAVKQ